MNHKTAEELTAFETRIKGIFEAGELPFLLHLCGGNEAQLVEIFRYIQPGDWIFSNHRAHFHALLAGIPEETIEGKIRNGDSMFIFSQARRFYTSAILGGTPAIAAGVAWAIKAAGGSEKVFCFVGDGAEDNGSFCEAVRFVDGQNLPCTFIIEDNDRQVDTDYCERWGTAWRFSWPACVRRYRYASTYPHAGRGAGLTITFNPEAVARFTNGA